MMEDEIRTCFGMYSKFISGVIKLDKIYTDEIISRMSMEQIKTELNIMHMKYIVNSVYSISESSIGSIAYKHMKQLIDDHFSQNRVSLIDSDYLTIKSRLDKLENKEKDKNIINVTDVDDKPKGWLF